MKNLDVKITEKDGKIYVQSPYNSRFIKGVKAKGGKWIADTKEWAVPEKNLTALNELLMTCYGVSYEAGDVEEEEKVLVQFKAQDFEEDGKISIEGLTFITRKSRDAEVSYFNDVEVVQGEFKSSGGSMKYPTPDAGDDVILQAWIPKSFYEKHKDDLMIVDQEKEDKEKLLKEKEELLKRLEEIERELKIYRLKK